MDNIAGDILLPITSNCNEKLMLRESLSPFIFEGSFKITRENYKDLSGHLMEIIEQLSANGFEIDLKVVLDFKVTEM